MQNHHDVELPSFLYDFINGTISYNSDLNVSLSGKDFVVNRSDKLSKIFKIKNAKLKPIEFEELHSFFSLRKGSFYSFLMKDKSFCSVKNQILENNCEEDINSFAPFTEISDGFLSEKIDIKKPILDSIYIFKNVADQSFNFNHDKSIIELSMPVRFRESISFSFDFYTIVRIISKEISYNISEDGAVIIDDLILKGVV